MVEDILHISNN